MSSKWPDRKGVLIALPHAKKALRHGRAACLLHRTQSAPSAPLTHPPHLVNFVAILFSVPPNAES